MSGTSASIDWKLYESDTNSGGRCLALDFSTPPHAERGTDVDRHNGKLPACAPDPETTNDRIAFFDWNEMVLDAVVDEDGRVLESDVEPTSDAFHFIYGRTTADVANLAAIFDDGSHRDVPSKSRNFALVYERDLRLVALAWRSGDQSTKCELAWPDAIPSLEKCSAEPDE